jgi:hypothetical protein
MSGCDARSGFPRHRTVETGDLLKTSPELAPWRPEAGIEPQLSDAELVTLPVMQALPGFASGRRRIGHARVHLRHLFPYLPQQPGCSKRLRKATGLIARVNRILAAGTTLRTGDVRVAGSTPVECGRSRETVKRPDLAGWARYGYCVRPARARPSGLDRSCLSRYGRPSSRSTRPSKDSPASNATGAAPRPA